MKRFNFFMCFFVICILLTTIGCQKQASKESKAEHVTSEINVTDTLQSNKPDDLSATDKHQPKIKFEKELLDLGQIGPGAQTTGEFKFTNIGDGTLEITNISQCCGVVTQLDKNTYKSGESGVLKIEYNATGQLGIIRRQPIVESNDPVQSNVALIVKVEVVEKVTCEPDRLKLFLDEENASCPKLKIDSIDGQTFSIVGLKSTADCIIADFDPSLKANQFVLDLKVDMEKLADNTKGSINIMLSHPECKVASVLFDVLPKFELKPSMMIIFRAKPQEPITRQVTIQNNYKEAFEIESITSQENTIRLLNQSKISDGYTLDIEIMPPSDNGKPRFTDTLSIKIKNGKTLTIPCNGYYVQTNQ